MPNGEWIHAAAAAMAGRAKSVTVALLEIPLKEEKIKVEITVVSHCSVTRLFVKILAVCNSENEHNSIKMFHTICKFYQTPNKKPQK